MRAMWSGAISFGLVNIPIKLFSGAESNSLDLHMLRKGDLSPIKYLKVAANDGMEVPYSDIVKGYKYSDGEYIVLDDKDFESANVAKTKTLDILDFVMETEIDSRYYEKPYYLEPDKTGAKPYALLREALKKSKKVGIASFVIRNRENIGVLKPIGKVLVLNQLRYAEEVRSFDELKLPEAKSVTDKEIQLALSLIDQLTTKFKPENYKDTYVEDLMKIIEDKAKGRKPKPKGKEPKPTKVVDMMELLKKSLKEKRSRAA